MLAAQQLHRVGLEKGKGGAGLHEEGNGAEGRGDWPRGQAIRRTRLSATDPTVRPQVASSQ